MGWRVEGGVDGDDGEVNSTHVGESEGRLDGIVEGAKDGFTLGVSDEVGC